MHPDQLRRIDRWKVGEVPRIGAGVSGANVSALEQEKGTYFANASLQSDLRWRARRKGRDKRPGLDAMLKAVNAKEFDMVASWSVDRLGRSLTDLPHL